MDILYECKNFINSYTYEILIGLLIGIILIVTWVFLRAIRRGIDTLNFKVGELALKVSEEQRNGQVCININNNQNDANGESLVETEILEKNLKDEIESIDEIEQSDVKVETDKSSNINRFNTRDCNVSRSGTVFTQEELETQIKE